MSSSEVKCWECAYIDYAIECSERDLQEGEKMKAIEEYRAYKRTFEHHCEICKQCGQYSGSTRDLPLLCYMGTQAFILMMDAKRKVPRTELRGEAA